jgi:RNA polymerase sigma-70 factor (ECF subfamily)
MVAPEGRWVRPAEMSALHVVVESDEDLLARVAEGDQRAFEALYRRYARPLFGFALRRLGDPGGAEEVVQQVFVAVWRSAAKFDPVRGRAESWLFGIARKAIIDALRIGSRSRWDPVAELPERASPERPPDQLVEEDWVAFCVHAAVSELPDRERVPLELAYWHGRRQSEIANLLGLPLGTVKTRMRSGLARLAARLEGTT